MHEAFELALTPDGRREIGTSDLLRAASEAGFAAVGLSAGRANGDTAQAYAAAGVRCHELLALVVTGDESTTLGHAERLAEAAATVGAEWVLTVFAAGLDAGAGPVVKRAAQILTDAGRGMAVECSPLGPVSDLAAGLEVVAAAGDARAGLMIDSWHFCHGAGTWTDLARVPLEQIAYVQFADGLAPVLPDLMRETMDRRALPGEGVLELDRFAGTLRDRGWRGTVSVEVLNRELRAVPVEEFAHRAYTATARYWL